METIHLTNITLLLCNGTPQNPDVPLAGTACKLGDFLFTDGFFLAKFNGKLYQRMGAADIFKHLTNRIPHPLISDSGRDWQTLPGGYKEYCADFCSAQLVHYGLKQPQSGASSMEQLLQSFGGHDGRTLMVPMSILELEKAMSASNWATGGYDRSADEPGSQTDVKLDKSSLTRRETKNASSNNDELAAISSMKSLKRAHRSSPGHQSPERNVRKRSKSPKQIVNLKPKQWVKMYKEQNTKSVMSISEIHAGIKSLKANEARQLLGNLLDKSPPAREIYGTELIFAVKGGVSSHIKSLKANEVREMLTALANKSSSVEGVLAGDLPSFVKGHSSSGPTLVSASQLGGLYDIEAPYLDSPYGHTFEVYPSSTSSHFWASFDLGVVSGVMRSIHAPPNSFDTDVYFEWRGRQTGGMTFQVDNRAIITFLRGGLLTGKIFVPGHRTFKIYGSIQISGTSNTGITRKGANEQLAEVRSYKKMWRALNEYNDDLEIDAMWGNRVGKFKDEEAYQSDTTIGEGKRPWRINIQEFMSEPDTDPDYYDEEDEFSAQEDSEDGEDEEDSDEEDTQDEGSEENSQDEDSGQMSEEQDSGNEEY